MTTRNIVIFQIQNGEPDRNEGWLDYCREDVPADQDPQAWAAGWCKTLEKREGKPFRAKHETW